MDECEELLKTELQKGNLDALKQKRKKRIQEAISFTVGTQEKPEKHIIAFLPNGTEVFFLKPGKEFFREDPNLYDMTPMIGNSNFILRFDQIFEIILKISLVNANSFKKMLVLIYRLAYMLDFNENENHCIRYMPSDKITKCINDLEKVIKAYLPEYGLWGFLHFLDLLGWNEDDKYHIENGEPTFDGKYGPGVGRINTLLSCIGVPYMAASFVEHVLKNKNEPENIDHKILVDIIQRLLKSRGICIPNQKEVLEWLGPYVFDKAKDK